VSRLELAPRGDGWGLPLGGQQVTRVWLDNESIGLLCENMAEVSISEPFVLTSPDGRRETLDPAGRPVALAPVLAFAGGTLISVPPGPDYEAWTIAGPGGIDGLKIVSMPGGELALWSDRRPPR
jgi:hypothetical protein